MANQHPWPAFDRLYSGTIRSINEEFPDVSDNSLCRHIYQALNAKGPMQLIQVQVATPYERIERKRCLRLLKGMQKTRAVFKQGRYWKDYETYMDEVEARLEQQRDEQ